MDIKKMIEKQLGINLDELQKEGVKVPMLLEELVKASNAQTRAIKEQDKIIKERDQTIRELIVRIDGIDQKTDHIYNKLFEKKS